MPIQEHGLGRQDLRLGLELPMTLKGLPVTVAAGPGCSCPLLISIKAWKDRVTFLCEGVVLPNRGLKGWRSCLLGLCANYSKYISMNILLTQFYLHKNICTKYPLLSSSLFGTGKKSRIELNCQCFRWDFRFG